jgi:hypothetical protein
MRRNLTLQLDEETVHQAKILAARRSTSLSRLVADEIERLIDEDNEYRSARQRAVDHLEDAFHLGGAAPPARESLHDR